MQTCTISLPYLHSEKQIDTFCSISRNTPTDISSTPQLGLGFPFAGRPPGTATGSLLQSNLDARPRPIFYMRHFIAFFLPVHKYSVFFYTIHRSAATRASVMLKFHSEGITVQALERTDAAPRNVFFNVPPIMRAAPPPLDMSCIRCLHREGGGGTWRGERRPWPA